MPENLTSVFRILFLLYEFSAYFQYYRVEIFYHCTSELQLLNPNNLSNVISCLDQIFTGGLLNHSPVGMRPQIHVKCENFDNFMLVSPKHFKQHTLFDKRVKCQKQKLDLNHTFHILLTPSSFPRLCFHSHQKGQRRIFQSTGQYSPKEIATLLMDLN